MFKTFKEYVQYREAVTPVGRKGPRIYKGAEILGKGPEAEAAYRSGRTAHERQTGMPAPQKGRVLVSGDPQLAKRAYEIGSPTPAPKHPTTGGPPMKATWEFPQQQLGDPRLARPGELPKPSPWADKPHDLDPFGDDDDSSSWIDLGPPLSDLPKEPTAEKGADAWTQTVNQVGDQLLRQYGSSALASVPLTTIAKLLPKGWTPDQYADAADQIGKWARQLRQAQQGSQPA